MRTLAHSLHIVGWGAVSTLACTARQTGFFLRAGRKSVALSPFIDVWGERILVAYNPTLPSGMSGHERMLRLAADALIPTWSQTGRRGSRVRISLALAETFAVAPGSGELNSEGRQFVQDLRRCLPEPLQAAPISALPWGRAAGIKAINEAQSWLESGEADLVFIGGVDSYYDWSRLEPLMKQDRLLTDDNLDGFYPGEGAAFAALSSGSTETVFARIGGTGCGVERDSILSESPSRAEGATQALREAVTELRTLGRRCDYWFVDLTHEQYCLKEFQIIITRFSRIIGLGTALQTPLRDLGNIGAATVPMFCVLACESWLRRYAADRFAVCLAGSDSGLRGALLLEGLV